MRRKMCRILFDQTKSCRRGFVWRTGIGIGEGVNRLFFAAREGVASLDTFAWIFLLSSNDCFNFVEILRVLVDL